MFLWRAKHVEIPVGRAGRVLNPGAFGAFTNGGADDCYAAVGDAIRDHAGDELQFVRGFLQRRTLVRWTAVRPEAWAEEMVQYQRSVLPAPLLVAQSGARAGLS